MTEQAASALLHQRVVLWLMEELLREGIVPFVPASAGTGLDAVLRYADGSYRDLIVLPSADEHFPLAFEARDVEARPRLFVVCIAWALSPVQCWIFPAQDFAREAREAAVGSLHLDLEARAPDSSAKLKQTLGRYRNAWRLLTDGAMREFTP